MTVMAMQVEPSARKAWAGKNEERAGYVSLSVQGPAGSGGHACQLLFLVQKACNEHCSTFVYEVMQMLSQGQYLTQAVTFKLCRKNARPGAALIHAP